MCIAWLLLVVLVPGVRALGLRRQEPTGSIRGLVLDQDFEAPLPAAEVLIVETGQKATTTDQGSFVISDVLPGSYTVIFSKEGYVRSVKQNVVVGAGRLTDADAQLAGDFTEMEEFVVEDVIGLGGGTEVGLLNLRFENAAFLDSVSSELMSRAGASDAASALRLVSGATIQDGKFAVIRGLPDRYVSSQLNGLRLPSADENTRAVELDQFPSSVIESIQVSKTFTPDQQGDASGGAVDVRLRGIPEERIFQFKIGTSYNTNVAGRNNFLSYEGGGLDPFGSDSGRRIQTENLGGNWDGAVGVSERGAPVDWKGSMAFGDKMLMDNGWTLGGFGSFFYERDSAYYDDGRIDDLIVEQPGQGLVPVTQQGNPDFTDPETGDFRTSLFDTRRGTQTLQWGALGSVGIENEDHSISLSYLFSRTAEDRATLAEDTRGKEFFFPDYDPNDNTGPGNTQDTQDAAPYLRTHTLQYTERNTDSLQLQGEHKLPFEGATLGKALTFKRPVVNWAVAKSTADLDQPDKRQFGSRWNAESFNPGLPPFLPPTLTPATYFPYLPAANFNLGNLQRIFKKIEEESDQGKIDLEFPFEQWKGAEGYFKVGLFNDRVDRRFDQDSFANFADFSTTPLGFDEFWTDVFPFEDHPITSAETDVDYDGEQKISAFYGMFDFPIDPTLKFIGGARVESTDISIRNTPEADAVIFSSNGGGPAQFDPAEADVDFDSDDILPSFGVVYDPTETVTMRTSYSRTIARQTFRELSPIFQQEFLGGPVFIGNPDLDLAKLQNYDFRLDYRPYDGGLWSVSWFYKDIEDPIESVQALNDFVFTTPVNYEEGELTGWEFEIRQDLGQFWDEARGISVGANVTFIDSEVTISEEEQAFLAAVDAPQSKRDATNAPEYLYNLYATYDIEDTGTQLGIFYTVRGDTLVAGTSAPGDALIPNLYDREFGTLNLTASQRLGDDWRLQFQAKNLTNPKIRQVYRSDYVAGGDTLRSTFTRGMEFSVSLSASF